jgi:hypothetical protein
LFDVLIDVRRLAVKRSLFPGLCLVVAGFGVSAAAASLEPRVAKPDDQTGPHVIGELPPKKVNETPPELPEKANQIALAWFDENWKAKAEVMSAGPTDLSAL